MTAMKGVSIPWKELQDGKPVFGCKTEKELFQRLRASGVGSVELRTVAPSDDPAQVLLAARKIWQAGLTLTVHGSVTDEAHAAEDVFAPLSGLLAEPGQPSLIVVIHPIPGDNHAMLRKLADHIHTHHLPVRIALENNRLLPDKTPGDSAALVAAAVEGVDPAVVGICMDMGHYFYQVQKDPGQRPTEAFRRRVIHTHIHALHQMTTHFPLRDYDLPLKEYIDWFGTEYAGLYQLELEPARYPALDPQTALFDSLVVLDASIDYTQRMMRRVRTRFSDDMRRACTIFAQDAETTRCALLNASAYLFNTRGTLWAMDVALRLAGNIPGMREQLHDCLRSLRYMVITHEHIDHWEETTVQALADLPITWILPEFLAHTPHVSHLDPKRILWARAGEALQLENLTLLPFESRHFRPGTNNGLPELGYLITCADGKRLLFPGDIRNYDPCNFPDIHDVDWLFFHLWLGDCDTRNADRGDYERQALAFIRSFLPKNLNIAHLWEGGRTEDGMWRYSHAGRIMTLCALQAPEIRVHLPENGDLWEL